jgi:hypothetical protein
VGSALRQGGSRVFHRGCVVLCTSLEIYPQACLSHAEACILLLIVRGPRACLSHAEADLVDLVGSCGGGEQKVLQPLPQIRALRPLPQIRVLRPLPQIRALRAPARCQTLRPTRRCVQRASQ